MFKGIGNQPVKYVNLGFGSLNISMNTLALMKSAILQSAKNPVVRRWAEKIVEGVPAKDEWAEAEAVYHFVQNHSRYVKDPTNVEMLQSPLVAFDYWEKGQVWQGDCDDMTILALSLLSSIGYHTALRAASYSPSKVLGHVYGLVQLYGEWMPIDEIQPGAYVGWEKTPNTKQIDFPVN